MKYRITVGAHGQNGFFDGDYVCDGTTELAEKLRKILENRPGYKPMSVSRAFSVGYAIANLRPGEIHTLPFEGISITALRGE